MLTFGDHLVVKTLSSSSILDVDLAKECVLSIRSKISETLHADLPHLLYSDVFIPLFQR